MKKALISPNEPVVNFDDTTGYRCAEVVAQTFEVALPLFWVDCDDACVSDQWYYNTKIKECVPKPIESVPPEPTE
jgi:hypothetical protein